MCHGRALERHCESSLPVGCVAWRGAQVAQLEEFHQNQVRALQVVCRQVSDQASVLRALQIEGEQLARELAELGVP